MKLQGNRILDEIKIGNMVQNIIKKDLFINNGYNCV